MCKVEDNSHKSAHFYEIWMRKNIYKLIETISFASWMTSLRQISLQVDAEKD